MIRITEEHGRWLVNHLEQVTGYPLVSELVQTITAQLTTAAHFDDLIDTIVKVVSEPRVSTLGKDALAHLRKALLSPVELARFNTQILKGQECSRCGFELGSYEMVCIRDRQIFCFACAHPEVITCHSCHERLDASGLNKSIQRLVGRHSCAGPAAPPSDMQTNTGWAPPLLQESASSSPTRTWTTAGSRMIGSTTLGIAEPGTLFMEDEG